MRNRARALQALPVAALCAGLLAGPVAAAAAGSADKAAPQGEYSRYRIVLAEAGEKGEPLVIDLHARDGRPSTGWATVGYDTGFIRHHPLGCEGDRLRGRLAVDVGPLQYACRLDARLAGSELAGTYQARRGIVGAVAGIAGTAAGTLAPRAEGGDLEVELNLWSMYTEFGHIRNPTVKATVRGGTIAGGTFEFDRGAANRGRLDGGALRVRDGRLSGTVRATVLEGDASPGQYTFAIDVPIRSNFVQGTYDTTTGGKNWGTHGLTGEVRSLGSPGDDGVLVLTLEGGIADDRPLVLYLERQLDGFTGGMARGGNGAFHEVDASKLRLADGGVSGPVAVTILPEGDFPPGGREVKCEYTVKAAMKDGKAAGTFTGSYGVQTPLAGRLEGRILTAEELRQQFYRAAGK